MHKLWNFKNFDAAELDLFRPMTLLIGRNGSGKSNVIEAVELLAQIAHGRPLNEITDIGRGGAMAFEIRGGLLGCVKYSPDKYKGFFELGFEGIRVNENILIYYNLAIAVHPQPMVVFERLLWGKRTIFKTTTDRRDGILDVEFNNFKKGPNKIIQLSSERSILSRYESFAISDSSNQRQNDAKNLVRLVEGYLNYAFVFDPNPKLIRDYERIGQPFLVRNGANLSSVLHTLHQGNEHQKTVLNRILDNIKQFPDESFAEFEFITTRLNDVIFALKQTDGALVDARLLSDGTLRALAILTALETVPEHSRIIIEEMDNGIHPSRVKLLVDAIWEASHRRNLNVLVTTHNPATLDSLSAEQLESVVLCYHDNEQNTSKLTPLLDLPRADVLLERGRLGDLVTRRVIEQHLAPDFDEEQKRKAKAWLESLA